MSIVLKYIPLSMPPASKNAKMEEKDPHTKLRLANAIARLSGKRSA